MRTCTSVVSAGLVMLAVSASGATAQEPSGPAAFVLSPGSRVRCLDREARQLMEAAVADSPTIARLVTVLQSTDLVVGIEAHAFTKKSLKGDARVIAASPGVRHLRIRIGIPGAQSDLIAVLGHELQHAVEIADAPDVRDAATLRAHYLRIGHEPMGRGYYETDAAVEVGRRVSAEVAGSRARRLMASR